MAATRRLSHDANHFAALANGAGCLVGHDTSRRRYNHRAHAAEHLRHLVLTAIDTQPRTAHPFQPVNHRPTVEILQVHSQLRLAIARVDIEIADVALVLQHLEDRSLELRGRHGDARLARALPIADTRQQISDRISHTHLIGSYQLALVRPGISPRDATSRIFERARPNLRYTPRERPVIAQRLRWRVGLASRGKVCNFAWPAARSSGEDFG